jgi:hypothetical protein
MSWDPAVNRQDAIETACHNALRAVFNEVEVAHREQRSFDDRLALAAALEEIERERTADHPGLSLPFSIQDCIAHLRATAAPRREVQP